MSFENQVVLVTGASRGIGAAIADQFAKAGAIVIGTATTEEGAKAITSRLNPIRKGNEGMVLDVTRPEQCQQLFELITTRHAAPQVLINNAGITRDNLFLRMKDDEWRQVIDTNLNALYTLCKLAVKPMLKARYGRIVNLTSIVGVMGNAGQANYAAAKAGMIGFTKSLAMEVASRHITVNAVAPGFIDTDMTGLLNAQQRQELINRIPAGRMGTPEDIAHAVLFLAAPQSAYITGQTLHVNGGMLCI